MSTCTSHGYLSQILHMNTNFFLSFQGEVIDVQYGAVEDLQRVTQIKNISKKSIALLKLGFLPLLYKVSNKDQCMHTKE